MDSIFMQIQSFCIVLFMIIGIRLSANRKMHVKIMSSAMIWDILLILQIELSRSAILKASKALTNSTLLNIHVSIAVLTVIFYSFMIFTGRKVIYGSLNFKSKHKFLGYITFSLRVLTFLTSFWAVTPKE